AEIRIAVERLFTDDLVVRIARRNHELHVRDCTTALRAQLRGRLPGEDDADLRLVDDALADRGVVHLQHDVGADGNFPRDAFLELAVQPSRDQTAEATADFLA